MKKVHTQAEVVESAVVAASTLVLRVRAPEVSRLALPGQFVMLGPLSDDASDPFLNRPLSIHRRHEDGLEFLVGIVGRGTARLARLRPGDSVGVLGPLGRGFQVPDDASRLMLVAGGLGLAPLVFLAEELQAAGRRPSLLYGVASAENLVDLDPLLRQGVQVRLATDDGSAGLRGTAVDLMRNGVAEASPLRPAEVYVAACGPLGMLRGAAALGASHGLSVEVSLETRMACGVGACLGCTVFLADGTGRRVCCEGPVFSASEVFGA